MDPALVISFAVGLVSGGALLYLTVDGRKSPPGAPERRAHPVVTHSAKPPLPDLAPEARVTEDQPTGGGHHRHDSTPGRWGGPYV